MKWDYFTYIKQPYWFIEGLRSKINIDIGHSNKEQQKLNRKNGN